MSDLKVYTASAGSGKTFLLTLHYIQLLIQQPELYRHILAVTFTNKATTEMKTRILDELYNLAYGHKSKYKSQLLELLNDENENKLQQNAHRALTNILHDYSHFYVSTIDRFFQSVFKNFTKEIGIPNTYTIELDTDFVLQNVRENLLEKIGTDKGLLNWLTEFVKIKIRDGRSWNLKKDISDLGKQVFKENFNVFNNQGNLKEEERKGIKNLIVKLIKEKTQFCKELNELANEVVSIYKNMGLTVDNIKRKSSGVAGYLEKVNENTYREPTNSVRNAINGIEKWVTKSAPSEVQHKMDGIFHQLQRGLQQYLYHYDVNIRRIKTGEVILKNSYMLGILSNIISELRAYNEAQNYVLLPDSMRLLNKIIAENDTPFVYEKAGNRYRHFLIDEFQDTSHVQWQNFLPLIANALSEDHFSLVVGDVKQSIYRFRNSDWKIMSNHIEKDIKPWKTEHFTLPQNWRSAENIVAFNNHFYEKLLEDLPNLESSLLEYNYGKQMLKDIQQAYQQHNQQVAIVGKNKGYVEIKAHTEKENFEEEALKYLENTVDRLLENNFKPHHIAILVRKKKEAGIIAHYLSSRNNEKTENKPYRIVSDESFFVKNAVSIKVIDQLLRFMATQETMYIRTVEELLKRQTDLKKWENLSDEVKANYSELQKKGLYELVEHFISMFELGQLEGERPYIHAFQDFILEFLQKRTQPTLSAFLNYWDEKKDKLCLQNAENKDAIQILTIHKAKGLEFEAVIIPFCNWIIDNVSVGDNILWCNPPAYLKLNNFSAIPVRYGNPLKESDFMDAYYEEKAQRLMDNLNILYVATTRPKNALFIFTQTDFEKQRATRIGNFFQKVFVSNDKQFFTDKWDNIKNQFSFGNLYNHSPDDDTNDVQNMVLSQYMSSYSIQKLGLRYMVNDFYKQDEVSEMTPIRKGILYHYLLQMIDTKKDIHKAVLRLNSEGYIFEEDMPEYEKYLTDLLNQSNISDWFEGSWKVMNERTILTPGSRKYRPDRMMTKNGKVVVLDYKFGEMKKNLHKSQLIKYTDILHQMDYEKVYGYIYYGSDNDLVKVV